MKKTLLIGVVVAAAFWLSGCMSFSYDERRCERRPRAMRAPSREVIEIVHIPSHRPGPHQYGPPPHARW